MPGCFRLAWIMLVAGTLLACTPASAPVTLRVALQGPHYRLANGLEVILHPDRTLRHVVVDVRYHVGSKDDPPERSGFAHLYEHLMFLGTQNLEGNFTKALEWAAVLEHNASTTQDATEYYEVLPPSQLPMALWLEADRMANPIDRLDEEAFRHERDVVKNEWRERNDNEPYGHLSTFVHAALFPKRHPYHRPTIGSVEDLDRATLAEAQAFAKRYYLPNNATLVIAGDFDIAEVRPIVERLFASIPAGYPLEPQRFNPVRLREDRRVDVEADVAAPRVVVAWPVPPPHALGSHELEFAVHYLAGFTHRELTDRKIARRVDWELDPGRLGSVLTINMDLEPDESIEKAVAALEYNLKRAARADAYESTSFATIRTQRMTRSVLSLSNPAERAARIQDYVEYFGEPDAAQTELRLIQAVRPAEAADAVEALLTDTGKVIVAVRPRAGAPRAGMVLR